MNKKEKGQQLMTTNGHLEILRKMLFRIILVTFLIAVIVFCFKQQTFDVLLAPKSSGFITFQWIENLMHNINPDFKFESYNISLISTELSSQFMSHIYVSCILGLLLASPYILFEIFLFISPALYKSERKYSIWVALSIYFFFFMGVLMSYYILFPISFRFLATYQVDSSVTSTITLDSYITTFSTLVFLTGILFQLPLLVILLNRMGFITYDGLKHYRPYALVVIMIIAAIITPPDIFTLIIVTVPIYGLYELSLLLIKKKPGTQELES